MTALAALATRLLPHGIALAALLGAILWIDRNAATRTRAQIETARIMSENQLRAELRRSEQRLAGSIGAIGTRVTGQIDALDARHATIIQPTLIRELTRETRFSDPAAGITDGVRAELNRALAAVACAPRPAGGLVCTLPDAAAAGAQ